MPSAQWRPIKLSAKVFGHISQGLYRTPAGAIKELISNSYDANATSVKIHTAFPHFETFSCTDNGAGILGAEFKRLVEQGIGTSYKRVGDALTPIYHRPVIGRLGIGILALAHICTSFDIISHHRATRTAFKATIKFPPYTKQEIDKAIQQARRTNAREEFVRGGEYLLETIPYDPAKPSVTIFSHLLRESFRKRMKNLTSYAKKLVLDKPDPYSSFEEFMNCIYGTKEKTPSLNLRSDYDQLLFGLSLASPSPYFESGDANIALAVPLLRQYQITMQSYKFRVEVDNIQLARPLSLPSTREGHTAKDCQVQAPESKTFQLRDGTHKETAYIKRYPLTVRGADVRFSLYELSYNHPKVAGRPLEFTGYLFQQTGRLYPRDIQGVLTRIRHVAIGGYDSGIMLYPYAEGPRYSMVTTELFIHNGFEDALNIDRESFNTLDPHYIRTQAYVHGLLHEVIFPETWTEEKARNVQRRVRRAALQQERFLQLLSHVTRDKYRTLEHLDHRKIKAPLGLDQPPVRFNARTHAIELFSSHPQLAKLLSRRKYARLAEQIVIAYETACRETTESKRRALFYKLLTSILERA